MSHHQIYQWIAHLSGTHEHMVPDERDRICLLLDQQSREWWLEVAPDQSVLLITTALTGPLDTNGLTSANLQHWLKLNGEVNRMGGAWLGLEGDLPTLTLYAQLSLAHYDEPQLDNLMSQLAELAHELGSRLYDGQQ